MPLTSDDIRAMTRNLIRLAAFLAVVCLAAPRAADAQTGRVWRVGYMSSSTIDAGSGFTAFRTRLHELGYVEGQNLVLEIRAARGKQETLPGLAAELVNLNVDVIVAGGRGTAEAAQKATTSIPIVMVIAADPVASGLVASLARPGGNVTGLTVQYSDVAGKRLQLLKEVVPNLSRVLLLVEPGPSPAAPSESEAATILGLKLHEVEVRSAVEFDHAFVAATRDRVGAAVVGGPVAFYHRTQVAQFAIKRRLPLVGPSSDYAESGCLIGFGPSYTEQSRRAADFVDRILKGAKPADLPVEQPTKFYLTINLKTAKTLGLKIPHSILQRADKVIE